MNDPNWFLVGDIETNKSFGYVPSNYLEIGTGRVQQLQAPVQQPPIQGTQAPSSSIANFAPPPIHKERGMSASPLAQPQFQPPPMHPSQAHHADEDLNRDVPHDEDVANIDGDEDDDDDDDAPPPPMPSRPEAETPVRAQNKPLPTRYGQEDEENIEGGKEHSFDGEYFTWYIDEVDGRKKRAVIFSIGHGNVILKPNTSNPKKLKLKSASSLDQQWKIKNLTDFSHEKKHLFLEFKNPTASIELHTGSKDVAEAIMSILGDLKGAETAKGLKEVARASQASTGGSNRKIGRLLYDFEAQGDDELMSKEGDEVYIVNESNSKDWWMCENIGTGKQGVIPSTYIEIVGTSNLEKLTEGPLRMKSTRSTRSSKGRIVENDDGGHRKSKNHNHHRRTREERNKIRENDRIQRDKSRHSDGNDKSMPNFHRVRTWIDSSGTFKVEAEFLGCVEGKIHLHKTNGVKIAVAAAKLSLEDLEYVEKITGTSLESYKHEVTKQMAKMNKSQKSGVTQSATSAINDIAPPQPTRPQPTQPKTTTAVSTGEPEYDWFEFFLSCGVDLGNCQRYSLNFNREQMDENILADINPSLLRTLGLREGDILRVMKFLDNKFDRKKSTTEEQSTPAGGLFTEPTGALKNNNSAAEVFKVDSKALPSPQRSEENIQTQQSQQPHPPTQQNQQTPSKTFEDDAWAVKPAARSNEDVSKMASPQQPQQPQYTGSLQDLVNIKPLELNNKPTTPSATQLSSQEKEPSAPSLTPVKTGNGVASQTSGTLVPAQRTGGLVPVQRTGGLIPVQRTGGLVPVQQTGGFIPVQPTGFMPITAQPTGFVPIQATGGLQPQLTFGIVPLQTGANTFTGQSIVQQKTGGNSVPQTSFGQPAFQQLPMGNTVMPQTSFGQGPIPTGQVTGGMPSTSFGGQPLSLQRTGPLVPAQRTGGQPTGGMMPQTSFGQQSNVPMMPQTSFGIQNPLNMFQPMGGQATGGNSFPSFGGQATGGNSFQSFGGQATGGFQPNNMGQQPSFGNQPTGGFQSFNSMQQQPSFGQQMMPQTTFGAPQQQPSFNLFQQQPNMNQLTNMFQGTNINGQNTFNQPQAQFPNTTFGQQPQFQPLQSQPTGAGFGNAPSALQNQPTGGRRANLQAATPDNPFGF